MTAPVPQIRLPYPYSPGSWLRAYRRRARDARRRTFLSPDELGARLGVSGKTVRRWEAGAAQPTLVDITLIAEVLAITPIEREVLRRMFVSRMFVSYEETPLQGGSVFKPAVEGMLGQSEFPAILADSLFYVRAFNSLTAALGDPPWVLDPRQHVLASHARALSGNQPPTPYQTSMYCSVQDFWLDTSHLAAQPEYRRVVVDLCEEPVFRRLWLQIAQEPQSPDRVAGAPFHYQMPDGSRFRVMMHAVVIPPLYHLLEYVPTNPQAWSRLANAGREQPVSVTFHPQAAHWSQEGSD